METNNRRNLTDVCDELDFRIEFVRSLADNVEEHYRSFELSKRGGGTRPIAASKDPLKRVQRKILFDLLDDFKFPPHVHGGVRRRSIITNAKPHVNKPVVLNADIENFYGVVTFEQVKAVFEEHFCLDDDASTVLAKLTTLRRALPQGAPTSTALANMAALHLDKAIIEFCNAKFGEKHFAYTRFIDDITISGAEELNEILPEIQAIMSKAGYSANENKLSVKTSKNRQKVTGVIVNKKVNVPRKLLRKLRQHLYYAQKYGIKEHCETVDAIPTVYYRQLRGLAAHVNQARPDIAESLADAIRRLEPYEPDNALTQKLITVQLAIFYRRTLSFMHKQTRNVAAPVRLHSGFGGKLAVQCYKTGKKSGWFDYLVDEMWDISTVEITDHKLLSEENFGATYTNAEIFGYDDGED